MDLEVEVALTGRVKGEPTLCFTCCVRTVYDTVVVENATPSNGSQTFRLRGRPGPDTPIHPKPAFYNFT